MKKNKLSAFQCINNILLFLFITICIYPFIYVLAISFNDAMDAQRGGIYFWPRIISIESYKAIFKNAGLLVSYEITIFRVVVGTFLHVILTSMFAFALTKKDFIFKRFLNWWVLIPMYFTGGIVPTYVIFHMLGLTNSILVYIVPHLLSTFNILLVRTFIGELPKALEESAVIDGASDFTVFFRIVFPLSSPVLAAVALFVGVFHWNDWFSGFTYMTNEKLWCAQNVLLQIIQSNEASNIAYISKMTQGLAITVTSESVKMAMLIVTVVPIVVIYPFLQKYFVKGMMIGSVKG